MTLDDLNQKWVYEKDKVDGWSVTATGDCDDYALTAAYILSDQSWVKFWFNVLFFRIVFWRVHTGSEPHLILRWKGMYIDNISREWFDTHDYKYIFPWVILPPMIAVKMIVGKFLK